MSTTQSQAYAVLGTAALVLLLSFIHRHRSRTRLTSSLPLPPGPRPLPLIGNLHQAPKKLQWLQWYRWARDAYGPVMHLDMAGQHLVILSSQAAARDLLSRRGARYSDRPRLVMAGELVTKGMHMLLRPYDAQYRLHQRMEAPLLNARAATCYQPLQELESRQTLFDISSAAGADGRQPVDFHHHFERSMASFVYALLYGYRLKTGREPELVAAQRVQGEFGRVAAVGAYLVDTFPALNRLPAALAPWKREGEALYRLEHALHIGNLDKGLRNPGWNFSKQMSESAEARGMSTVELAFDLGILADAALDTSTGELDWLMVAWVTCGSRWVEKAQQDIDRVVGRDRLPQFEDRPHLARVDAIVNEVLRWRPVVVGGFPHVTKTADTYLGYRIPAGSMVIGNHFAIGRDEAVFGADADAFDPDRWLAVDADGTCRLRDDLPFTGFGNGRRICTGRHIALNGLFIHVAHLLWAFSVEAGGVDDMACTEGFVSRPKHFKAEFRPRGPWVRPLVQSTTHDEDHTQLLDRAGKERMAALPKK